ncbi:MAG: leucyl aminopeptidase family protein [Myxococcales bacterium]|nr:leucyl aminopeptidase family protein [Myxococcales bacterium]MCB9645937.1 leucyl aminopeptidase family protein [Deltaproteobacteria bacterium]
MSRIVLAKDPASALKGAESALLVASAATFKQKLPRLFSPKVSKLVGELVKATKPGDHGSVASTLTGGEPGRLWVGVIPDGGSRYTAPGRPDAVHKVVSSAGVGSDKRAALFLWLADEAHLAGALGAVARAFPDYERKQTGTHNRVSLVVLGPDGAPLKLSTEAKEHLHSVQAAARLVDTAPSDLHPEALAAEAQALLDGVAGVTIEVIVGDDLVAKGLGGIYGVGKAAAVAPRMLVATYTPANPSGTHVALVGKGVTFDTGGLHLKPRGAMETMKCDMGGSAAVLGAFRVLARSKATNHTVSLVMCMAENAIGPGSYKPDDILTLHSGKTVEINNTDAEGRLLLGDGVSYAARELKADVIIDAATLTGAQMIATGSNHAAVMSNDGPLEAIAVQAGFISGDLVHPLPFAPEFYKPEFKSAVADMKNSVKNRANAQSSCAAQFVYNHIEDTRARWLHVDLAGPSFRNERGTGYGVGLIAEVVRRI